MTTQIGPTRHEGRTLCDGCVHGKGYLLCRAFDPPRGRDDPHDTPEWCPHPLPAQTLVEALLERIESLESRMREAESDIGSIRYPDD